MEQPEAGENRNDVAVNIWSQHNNRHIVRPLSPWSGENYPVRAGWLHLRLDSRSIVSSPPAFPPRMLSLNLSSNRLTYLPRNLPSDLEVLEVRRNRLRNLPNSLPSQLRTLDVSHNRLGTLPDSLPTGLQTLDLSYNHLVDISPETLNCLARMAPSSTVNLSFNPLSPETIERLERLQNSPGYRGPRIILGVIGLDLRSHNLHSVPHDLPSNLQELNLSCNPLTAPIHNLPRQLRTLNIHSAGLSRQPDNLPSDLQELDLSHNPLTAPINNLPRQLRILNIDSIGLTRLPDNLPPSLQTLRANFNNLRDISEDDINTLTRMAPSATVDLDYNPLSPQAFERLEQLQSSPTYRGPRITLPYRPPPTARPAAPVAQPAAPARVHEQALPADIAIQNVAQAVLARLDPEVAAGLLDLQRTAAEAGHPIGAADFMNMALDQLQLNPAQVNRQPAVPAVPAMRQPVPLTGLAAAVAAWGPEPPSDIAPNPHRWQEFSAEPSATAFSDFLARLTATVNANHPQFRNSVSEWLHHLETNPQLRSDTFTLSEDATATCNDRIYHTFNDMRQLRLAADVSNGDYDQRLPELLTLARGMFRLGQLETIARKHAASRPNVDEIEVYLGFQVMLRDRLALPLDTANMHYPSMAEIRPEHLERAYNRVIVAEREGFADYLATDWRPWQAVLQRQIPAQYEQAQEQLIDAMDEAFSTRLQVRLQEVGLENDPDAQRTMGPLVQAEIAREINGPLTQDFLRSKGLQIH